MRKQFALYFLAGSLIFNHVGIYASGSLALDSSTTIEDHLTAEDLTDWDDLFIPDHTTNTEEDLVVPDDSDTSEESVTPDDSTDTEDQVTPDDSMDIINADPEKAYMKIGSQQALVYGQPYTLAVPPQVISGRTLLPLRFVGETLLQGTVGYDQTTKKITILKDGNTVELTIGSNVATVNGHQVTLDTMPVIQQGTTLLPLRFLVETFELELNYDSTTKIIEVEKPVIIPNTAPSATFTFKEPTYTVGQQVEANVETFDADGHKIVAERWVLNHKWSQPYTSLAALSKALVPDYVPISLQVQDERGLWSEWHTEYIVIKPNSAPVIEQFETTKEDYAQGEAIEFKYDYTNEDFEGIKAEKWSYRHIDERLNQTILEKPRAIYEEGKYVVTLELQDDAGNWSKKKETIVEVTSKSLETEFEHMFTKGSPGDIITNFGNTNFRDYQDVDYIEMDEPGTLVMSNSPEVVQEEGILYEDTVQGVGRVMFHHIHAMNTSNKKKLMVVLENESDQPVQGTIMNNSSKGPSTDILFVGQQLLYDYLGTNTSTPITIQPKGRYVVYDSNPRNWFRDQAISGKFDFDFAAPVKITVAVMDANAPLDTLATLGTPAKDIHPRGTFNTINKDLFIDLSGQDKPSKILIGQGESDWLVGQDALTGETVTNRGNFGVEHHITITADEDTAVILNPRGNMYKGAVTWEGDKPFMTPKSGLFPDGKRAAYLGVVKKGTTRTFTYVLPNGSSAPVLIGFIPKSDWK